MGNYAELPQCGCTDELLYDHTHYCFHISTGGCLNIQGYRQRMYSNEDICNIPEVYYETYNKKLVYVKNGYFASIPRLDGKQDYQDVTIVKHKQVYYCRCNNYIFYTDDYNKRVCINLQVELTH